MLLLTKSVFSSFFSLLMSSSTLWYSWNFSFILHLSHSLILCHSLSYTHHHTQIHTRAHTFYTCIADSFSFTRKYTHKVTHSPISPFLFNNFFLFWFLLSFFLRPYVSVLLIILFPSLKKYWKSTVLISTLFYEKQFRSSPILNCKWMDVMRTSISGGISSTRDIYQ